MIYCAVGSGDSIWYCRVIHRRLGRTGRLVGQVPQLKANKYSSVNFTRFGIARAFSGQ